MSAMTDYDATMNQTLKIGGYFVLSIFSLFSERKLAAFSNKFFKGIIG